MSNSLLSKLLLFIVFLKISLFVPSLSTLIIYVPFFSSTLFSLPLLSLHYSQIFPHSLYSFLSILFPPPFNSIMIFFPLFLSSPIFFLIPYLLFLLLFFLLLFLLSFILLSFFPFPSSFLFLSSLISFLFSSFFL